MYQHPDFMQEFANDRLYVLADEAQNAQYDEARFAVRLAGVARRVGDSLSKWGRNLQARQQERGLQPVPAGIQHSRQNH